MQNKIHFFKSLMQQVSLISIYIISASPLQAQENINFNRIKTPIREFSSLSEEPLQWSMQRTNNSATTKNEIVWSTNTIKYKDAKVSDNSRTNHSLKWKILPDSDNEVNSNILLDTNPSIDIEALIPASSIQNDYN